MSNKYLSLEKSKRLVKLGYKPKNGIVVSSIDGDYPMIDCYDLLMELQKQQKEISPHGISWNLKMWPDGNWCFNSKLEKESDLIGNLGSALIKILEEKI